MLIINLLRIYHSFLWRKWYLLVYITVIFIALFVGILFVSQKNMEQALNLGIVDEDQTTETKMILSTLEGGKNIANQFKLLPLESEQAKQQLSKHKLDGYIILEKGMTEQFYNNGELPIRVQLYDETSVQSIIISQLTESVYERLMLSEAGILTYGEINKDATDKELIEVMMAMLIVGVDRQAAFDVEEIAVYSFTKYAMISALFLTIFLFFVTIFTIIRMNEEQALQQRLKLYPNAREKMVAVRILLSAMYTIFYTLATTVFLVKYTAIESYNMGYLAAVLAYYIVAIALMFYIGELLLHLFLKWIIVLLVILLSGATIPLMYLKHLHMEQQLFAQIFQALLELLHHNYLIDWTISFYVQFILLFILVIALVVWRRIR